MSTPKIFVKLLLLLALLAPFCLAQTDVKKTPDADKKTEISGDEEVLKISTEVIQTGVAVLDKKGQFVNNLSADDFEITVDGKAVPILFFDRITTKGSGAAAAKSEKSGEKPAQSINSAAKFAGSNRGRTVIFVVDDFHLSFESNKRARDLIMKFVEREMLPEDTVAVVSPSGKIGFLQQFTNDKTVLQTAVERLIYTRDRSANDRSIPPMTEYEALLVSQFDPEVTNIFAALEIGDGDIESKIEAVRSRARIILTQAAAINRGVYSTLEQAVRNSAALAGRKIVFFISDGFLLDPTNTDSSYLMKRITDAATRTNTVIYSFDAKGLDAGFPEGTSASAPNGGFRVQSGERFEVQDGLSLLADETGGRFVRNTNDLQTGLSASLAEASQFYLLAWEPILDAGKSEKFKKIEVRVKNRTDLKIRFQSGYFNENPAQADVNKNAENKNKRDKKTPDAAVLTVAEQQLNVAVSAQIPARQLSASLTLNYIDAPNEGALLAAAMQIKGDDLQFVPNGEKTAAEIDIVGIVYNADGKRQGYFRQLLSVDAPASKLSAANRSNVYYNYKTNLKPGLYQMRVAARDVKSGRVGSASQWIKIPDLASRKLALSSLILSEQKPTDNGGAQNKNAVSGGVLPEMPVSADRRFAASSRLRYVIFIYNAAQKANQPDVTLQTRIFRGKDLLVSSPLNPISVVGQDPQRLAYVAEISLNALPPGRYELVVSVQDRAAKNDAVQRTSFEVK